MKIKMLVTNIQRMCFHDGPGIRTTVFMKGCSLHCPWCSNPENINFMPEAYNADGVKNVYGKEYRAEELFAILMKDSGFWENGGGVTFSGGEALMQAEALCDVLKLLKGSGIHTAVETALFVPEENVRRIAPYTDYFIADVKILNRNTCKEILGGDVALYEKNIETLYKAGKLRLFRVPCCPEYTFTEENKSKLLKFFKKYSSVPVQIFEIHGLGEKKYASLRRRMWRSVGLEEKALCDYADFLVQQGISAEVIHI